MCLVRSISYMDSTAVEISPSCPGRSPCPRGGNGIAALVWPGQSQVAMMVNASHIVPTSPGQAIGRLHSRTTQGDQGLDDEGLDTLFTKQCPKPPCSEAPVYGL